MLSKIARKQKLVERAIARGMFSVAAFVTLSKGEIRETVREVKASVAHEMDDETREDEEIGFKSGLSFDEIKEAKDREESFLLSPEERAQLKRDRLAYRAARESVEGFTLPAPLEFA